MISRRSLLVIVLFIVSFGAASQAWSSDKPATPSNPPLIPDRVTLDGESYTRYELVYTFLKSAISTYIPANQTRFDEALVPPLMMTEETDDALQTAEGYRVQYPWIYEYMYRDKGMPRYAAINKWDSAHPVRVAIGFPNDLKPYEWLRLPIKTPNNDQFNEWRASTGAEPITHTESRLYERYAQTQDNNVVTMVEGEVRSMAPTLSNVTGLSISFMEQGQETAAQMANMRIILTTHDGSLVKTPFFKKGRSQTMVVGDRLAGKKGRDFRDQLEHYSLPTAVHFTPYSEKQVDGYFLPNADNTIGLSFCFIWQKHPPEMLRALVRECMLRAMGLPDATAMQSRGYLDLWNDPQKYPHRQKHPKVETLTVDEYVIPTQLSEYDRYFLRLLYSPAIKPGMSPIEVYRALMRRETANMKNSSQ